MEWFLKTLAAALLILMLVYLWPVYKHWQTHSPKAQPGDWLAASLPLAAVALLVILLIVAVR